jgi:anti-sigma regulatory factor (Ser/Thr protein kinase)
MARRAERGMRPGGFGILLAKKVVDELIYNERGNEVLLIKYVP